MSEEKKVYELTLDNAEKHFVEKMNIPAEELSVVKKQVAPGISNGDLLYCLQMQAETGLSIIKKELWIVPRKANINGKWVEKHEPMIGRRGARKIAASKGFKGTVKTHCEIKATPQLVNGKWEMKEDLVAVAELTHNDETHTIECDFSAFAGTTKSGDLTTFWRKMPKIMLMKVAEFQLLDKVFGLDGLGSYEAGYVADGNIEIQDGKGNIEGEVDKTEAMKNIFGGQ